MQVCQFCGSQTETSHFKARIGVDRDLDTIEFSGAVVDVEDIVSVIEDGNRMSPIAEFQIPTEEFALYETLKRLPDLKIEVDRVVAHGTTHVMPFVWVSGDGFEEATSVFEADPSVEDVELLTELDEERFYRMSWTDRTQIIGHMLVERDATVQRATASGNGWRLRVLFPKRDDLSAMNDYAKENEFTLNLIRVYDVDAIRRVRYDLTDVQHEALTEAFERGYFEVPRNTDQTELAKDLDISHQALSERLRRANHHLIKNALLVDEEENDFDENY